LSKLLTLSGLRERGVVYWLYDCIVTAR